MFKIYIHYFIYLNCRINVRILNKLLSVSSHDVGSKETEITYRCNT